MLRHDVRSRKMVLAMQHAATRPVVSVHVLGGASIAPVLARIPYLNMLPVWPDGMEHSSLLEAGACGCHTFICACGNK